jgi:hypothetical protein
MILASVENPPDAPMWIDAFEAKYYGKGNFGKESWDQLLGHCQVRDQRIPVTKLSGIYLQAVCDWPACIFAPELIKAYPNAKVAILNRDVDSWYRYVTSLIPLTANLI